MNLNAKIFQKILSINQIQQHIRSITIYHDQVMFILVMQMNSILKLKNLIYCINKLKKNHMMILTYAGKKFDKILSANQG